jgi:cation:H+ antiporter
MILMYYTASDLYMGQLNALVFLGCFAAYLFFVMTCERNRIAEAAKIDNESNGNDKKPHQSPHRLLFMTAVGLSALLGGSYLIVETGAGLARDLGVSETLIGISLVAVGTSLPELAAAIAAIRHKDTDLIMGNILGSNIFNVLLVLGTAGLLHPFEIEQSIAHIDILIMSLFSFALVPFMVKGRIGKSGGILFLAAYVIYIFWRFFSEI